MSCADTPLRLVDRFDIILMGAWGSQLHVEIQL